MDIDLRMSQADAARTSYQVDALNKELSGGKAFKTELDKDDFLKILITRPSMDFCRRSQVTFPKYTKELILKE